MTRMEQIQFLNEALLAELPQYRAQAASFPADADSQRRLLRALMNARPPMPLRPDVLAVQDALLSAEREERGVVDGSSLPVTAANPRLVLWRGDITRLRADAIVNAANSALLGCFVPCHGCIDNAIHTYAGIQLRCECAKMMAAQGKEEPAGRAKITKAYNLPCRWVLHTVGPIIYGAVTKTDRELLAGCYRSCLELAAAHGLQSVAFCCISTGEFHFPNELAAKTAVQTVRTWQQQNPNQIKVIFNVFKESDYEIYKRLLR